jgi:hypothetical protein
VGYGNVTDAQEFFQNPPALASHFDYVMDRSQPFLFIVYCLNKVMATKKWMSRKKEDNFEMVLNFTNLSMP